MVVRTEGERQPRRRGTEATLRIRAWRAKDDASRQDDVCRRAALEGLAGAVEAGREAYDRRRVLPQLIAFDIRDLDRGGAALALVIRARLERALRAERQRGRSGHWSYDLARHIGLAQALACEEALARGKTHGRRRVLTPQPERSATRRPEPAPETKSAARLTGRR